MASIWDYISSSGSGSQNRSKWLRDNIDQPISEAARYYLGAGNSIPNLLSMVTEGTPTESLGRASQASQQMFAPDQSIMDRITSAGNMLGETLNVGAGLLGTGQAARTVGPALEDATRAVGRDVAERLNQRGPMPTTGMNAANFFSEGAKPVNTNIDTLREAYQARADQMKLAPADRIQARMDRKRLIDQDYQSPAPAGIFENLADKYPRNPDPASKLPLDDRARVLVDRRDEISTRLAEKIRDAGQMDAATRYFYHSDGPIYRAAKNAGLSNQEASEYLKDFSQNFAATSPRTKVDENIRNATSAMAKTAQGIPHRQIVGPGSGGVSEKGYPMMTNPGGIHGQLLDQVISGEGINTMTNTKPAMFGANMVGNRSGVTVVTHAIRGVLQTLNDIEPGSVPDGFILPEFKAAYRKDPTKLTPNMIADTIGKQKIGEKGSKVDAQTEYPLFADIFHDTAMKLGADPAETQSMAWFGLGGDTNLKSAPRTVSDAFDERLDITAQALNISPEEAARRVFRRQIPLLGASGVGLLSQFDGQSSEGY